MEELALGRMMMGENELYEMRPRTLFNKINGFMFQENQKWERMRIHAHIGIMPYMDKKKPISPRELLKFPWDGELTKLSKEDKKRKHEEANKIWAKIDAQKNRDVGQ
ncbi:hypothetical protein ACOKFD_15635 [Flagellimonas sp. S174]|uniref:hypothetical protein n=1 Tax=Flagellimonas sp. S174 TaxID=3410790 RepID=UPI003BF4684B